ncbi:CapA family protein [Actinomycetota bacterium]
MARAARDVRRDRILTAFALAIALMATTAVAWRVRAGGLPTPATVAAQSRPVAGNGLAVRFAGDTMLGDGAQAMIATQGHYAPFAKAAPLLKGSPFTIINAEAPITASAIPANPGAKFSYATSPAGAPAIKQAGVDALSLSNNHTMDRGLVGLADTQKHAAAAGMTTFGAGRNLAEAERPLIISQSGKRLAVVALGENFGPTSRAAETSPGVVTLTPAKVQRGYDLAKAAGADKVIALLHWGDNYEPVNPQQRYWATTLAAAGYDAVIGAGSHTVQPVEMVGGIPVVFGLGNFVFGAPGRFDTKGVLGAGLVADVSWDAAGKGHLRVHCVRTDNNVVAYQARPCTAAEATRAWAMTGSTLRPAGATAMLEF